MNVGDIVKHADADESSIPAYRSMRGKILEVKADGLVRVLWFDPKYDASSGKRFLGQNTRRESTLLPATDTV